MLCARCQAAIRLPTDYPPEVDPDLRVVRVPARERRIDMVTLDVLGVLWQRRGRPVSMDTLNHLVWGAGLPASDQTVRAQITKLRQKLSGLPYSISNIYGGSYVFHDMSKAGR
jgi:DNA-binding response OmpR family regulator